MEKVFVSLHINTFPEELPAGLNTRWKLSGEELLEEEEQHRKRDRKSQTERKRLSAKSPRRVND